MDQACHPPFVWIQWLSSFSDMIPSSILRGLIRMVKRIRISWNQSTFLLLLVIMVVYFIPTSFADIQEQSYHSFSPLEIYKLQSEIQVDREEHCVMLNDYQTRLCREFFDSALQMVQHPDLVSSLMEKMDRFHPETQERIRLSGIYESMHTMKQTFIDMIQRDELRELAKLSLTWSGMKHPFHSHIINKGGIPELLLYSLIERTHQLTTISFIMPNIVRHPRIFTPDRSYSEMNRSYARFYHPTVMRYIETPNAEFRKTAELFQAELNEQIIPQLFRQPQRFMVIPFCIQIEDRGTHENALLFDKEIRRVIMIDPHGGTNRRYKQRKPMPYIGQTEEVGYYDELLVWIRSAFTINRQEPYEIVFADQQAVGIQFTEGLVEQQGNSVRRNRFGEPNGYCTVFVLMITELLVKYSQHSLEDIYHTYFWMVSQFHQQDVFLLARNYAAFLSLNLYEGLYQHREHPQIERLLNPYDPTWIEKVQEYESVVDSSGASTAAASTDREERFDGGVLAYDEQWDKKIQQYIDPYERNGVELVSEQTRKEIESYRWWIQREPGRDNVGSLEHVYLGRVVKRCLRELIRGEPEAIQRHQRYCSVICFHWNQYFYRVLPSIQEIVEPEKPRELDRFLMDCRMALTPTQEEMIRAYEELGIRNQTVRRQLYILGEEELDVKEQEAADLLRALHNSDTELTRLSRETTNFIEEMTLIRFRPTLLHPYPIRTQLNKQLERILRYFQKRGRTAMGGVVLVYDKEIAMERGQTISYIGIVQELLGYIRTLTS